MYSPDEFSLIAPCGMNCGVCMAYLRERKKCPGCRGPDSNMPASCAKCIIRNCASLQEDDARFCFGCEGFPCDRLKRLDKRYRTRYNMSMIENLGNIKKYGLQQFLINENTRWACSKCGGTICVHKGYCYSCGEPLCKRT